MCLLVWQHWIQFLDTVTNELYSLSNSKENEHKITVRLSAILIDTLKNIIASNKAGGNFEYTNVSDLLRKALEGIVKLTNDEYKKALILNFRQQEDLEQLHSKFP